MSVLSYFLIRIAVVAAVLWAVATISTPAPLDLSNEPWSDHSKGIQVPITNEVDA